MAVTMTWWPVRADLATLVDAVYVLRADAPCERALAGSLLPQVHWVLSGRYAWQAHGGALQPLPSVAAFGPSTAALWLETEGETVVAGTGLYPEGWAALLPMPAGSVIERVFDLAAVWGAKAEAPLAHPPNTDDRTIAAAVEALIAGQLAQAPQPDARIGTITRWANGAEHDLEALAAELDLSHRHLQRLTTAACGLPPRMLANKHKILRMAAVLALGGYDNRRDVWTREYADQPHFLRNFKRFIGVNPTRFLTEPDLLVREVMRVRMEIASRHPLGLATSGERMA